MRYEPRPALRGGWAVARVRRLFGLRLTACDLTFYAYAAQARRAAHLLNRVAR